MGARAVTEVFWRVPVFGPRNEVSAAALINQVELLGLLRCEEGVQMKEPGFDRGEPYREAFSVFVERGVRVSADFRVNFIAHPSEAVL